MKSEALLHLNRGDYGRKSENLTAAGPQQVTAGHNRGIGVEMQRKTQNAGRWLVGPTLVSLALNTKKFPPCRGKSQQLTGR